MTPGSLRFRLLVAAAVSVATAILIAGISLVLIFENHVERRIGSELETYLKQIIAAVDVTPDGHITFDKELADPRFTQPLSGLYWQIQDEDKPTLLRSRSLWDDVIPLPVDELLLGVMHRHRLPGPAGQSLLVHEQQVIFHPGREERRLRVVAAVDVQNLVESRNAFAADMLPYLIVIAVVLIIAAWIQVRIGLAPLARVRHGVMEIRSGRARRLEHEYPDEVMPLVDEINGLLQAQEQAIERARTWTADLAHGLKTPLMVLTADAQRLREQGDRSIADNLDQLAETMSKRVDRELVRARVRSGLQSRGTYSDVGEVIHRVVRTLQRSPKGARLEWSVQVPDGIVAAIPAEDLTELLGNIAENAVKWARKAVSVSAEGDGGVCIRIEDDGPGVEQEQLKQLGQRGVRLDEQTQGSGLGLAIARDVTEAYDGELSFDSATTGGLVVTVRLTVKQALTVK